MSKVLRTIEIPAELDAALEQLAKDSGRTREEMLTEALERYVADPDDIALDLDRLAEYERTGVALSEEEFREAVEKMKLRAVVKA